jgi:hypothetical protein
LGWDSLNIPSYAKMKFFFIRIDWVSCGNLQIRVSY